MNMKQSIQCRQNPIKMYHVIHFKRLKSSMRWIELASPSESDRIGFEVTFPFLSHFSFDNEADKFQQRISIIDKSNLFDHIKFDKLRSRKTKQCHSMLFKCGGKRHDKSKTSFSKSFTIQQKAQRSSPSTFFSLSSIQR